MRSESRGHFARAPGREPGISSNPGVAKVFIRAYAVQYRLGRIRLGVVVVVALGIESAC